MKTKTEKDQQALTFKILLVPVLIIIVQFPTMLLTSKFKEPYWKTSLVITVSALVTAFLIWILQKVQRFPSKKLNAQAWLGIVFSATIFGLLHISTDPIYFFSKFILGILLGMVYEKTKNIKASIIVHLLNNLSALVI